MKKLLLTLMYMGVGSVAFAGTATTGFSINGFLGSYCSAAMSSPSVSLSDLSQVSYGGNTLNVTCRTGTSYSISSTSTNGWQLMNDVNLGVGYNIAYTGAVAGVATQWSGPVGSTTPIEVAKDIISGSTTDTYPLIISNSIAPTSYKAGSYNDTVTITVSYI
jgi:spore coat protein U-like protein